MISSSEEHALQADAVRMQAEPDKDVSNSALRLAVQTGMERGQQRMKKRVFSRGMGLSAAAAVVAAAVLFILPYLHSAPQPVSTRQSVNWGELEVFKGNAVSSLDEPTLDSAIRNGYIQMVNQKAEANGYAITLNAITADENKIMFLYTAATDDKQEIYSINSAKMKDRMTNSYLNTTTQTGGNVTIPEPEKNHVYYGRGVVELDRTEPFPQQLEAEFRIASVNPGKLADRRTGTIMADMHYSPVLKVRFALDPKFQEYKTQIEKPNLPFTLNGHEVVLSQLEMSPLLIRARVALKNPGENDWKTREGIMENALFQGITSKVQGESVQLSPVSGNGTEDGFEYVFASNWLNDPESLVLKIKERESINKPAIQLEMYNKK
ncbi:DUF4179 domain-containing protein [Paenibacillus jilunlii]|uniref:Uncharacterized protein n=1 Tax=Paenibacillus jilunlii TaxID=682956 RepID=A0A1G9H8S4_9BACL|nr:DUF4179 domain-containing protein [Paenibacillus jilunlii]KWX77438.1 hypothetical protein AML91_07795 [Paenibacillus jilunlii]SDL09245.1 protein of unknown function [Paenibacillus jilunlii]